MKTKAAVSALTLMLGSAPAAAEQARTSMPVTATVVPGCSVAPLSSACPAAGAASTTTVARPNERPLAEAEALLGAPIRRRGTIIFTAPIAAPTAEDAAPSATRYVTITY